MDVSVRKHLRRRREPESIEHEHVIPSSRMAGNQTQAQMGKVGKRFVVVKRAAVISDAGEVITYNMSKVLGWPVVPPTVMRLDTVQGRNSYQDAVSLQQFIPRAREWSNLDAWEREQVVADPESGMMEIALLDIILGQSDRHGGNLLVTSRKIHGLEYDERRYRAWAIDNQYIGVHGADFIDMGNVPTKRLAGRPIPERLLQDMAEAEKGDFYAAMAGLSIRQINDAWERRAALVRLGRIRKDGGEWKAEVTRMKEVAQT